MPEDPATLTPKAITGGEASQQLAVLVGGDHVVAKPVDDASGKSKILRSEWRYGALFWLDGQYTSVYFELCTPVQSVSRCTAEVYFDAQDKSSCSFDSLANKAIHWQRLATTDGDGALAKTARAIANANPHKVSHFFFAKYTRRQTERKRSLNDTLLIM